MVKIKIPLQVSNYAGGLRAFANFFFKSDEINFTGGLIHAIVDSGSPDTIIGLDDVRSKRMSTLRISKLKSRKEPLNMGGERTDAKILENAKIKINGLDIDMKLIVSCENIQGLKGSQPSILGVDFLLKNRLKFVFDPTNNKAFLESVD